MRRWLSILLLVLLPFQFSWAAVAGYCQHETGAAAQHFGHHDHEHAAADTGDEPASAGSADSIGSIGSIDTDCGICHAGCCSIALFAVVGLAVLPKVSLEIPCDTDRCTAPPASLPERPNWSRSA